MIAVVCCINNESQYSEVLVPSLMRQSYTSLMMIELRDQGDIHTAYNSALSMIRHSDAEAAIFVHQDVELRSTHVVRHALEIVSQEGIAVAGPIGARGVQSLRWWEAEMRGKVTDTNFTLHTDDPFGEVEALDGMFLAMSRFGIDHLNFDPQYGGFHGYDVDICFAARQLGQRVMSADLPMHHHTKGGYGDQSSYERAQQYFAYKWHDAIKAPSRAMASL